MRRIVPLAALMLGACSLEPRYVRPVAATPVALPADAAVPVPPFSYLQAFRDPALRRVIVQAVANNQDLKAAIANVAIARGQYRIQRAARLPQLTGDAGVTFRRQSSGITGSGTVIEGQPGTGEGEQRRASPVRTVYTANLGATFELDLFGRLRSLSNQALDQYLATEAGVRAARLTLVGDVAAAWATLATDRSLLAIAAETRVSAERSLRLTRIRLDGGVSPRSEYRQAETVLAQAEADYADLTAQVQEDRNALELLVGARVDDADLPASIEAVEPAFAPPPAGIDSRVLLRRPDVVQAEYRLRGANAGIGAARAAFFPTIGLTATAGLASTALSSLFTSSAFAWSAGPALSLPIFDGGARRGDLQAARGQFDLALATYQSTIQQAFRDVADATARSGVIDAQVAAQARLANAAADTLALSELRYREGIDAYLQTLDAQRTLYASRRSLAQARLERANNRVNLYRALGGDELTDLEPRRDAPAAGSALAPAPATATPTAPE